MEPVDVRIGKPCSLKAWLGVLYCLCILVFAASGTAFEADLAQTVKQIKPSIVGVGTYQKLRKPPSKFLGTGFVVANGNYVVTTSHVYPKKIDRSQKEVAVIFVGVGRSVSTRKVELVAEDTEHDVAILKFAAAPLTPLKFGNQGKVEEGQEIAFTPTSATRGSRGC